MENKSQIDKMLLLLSQAPDGQIDKKITNDLKNLIGKPIPEIKLGVVKAIDYCVYGSLASEFGLQSLYVT